jgi:GT2 family glycosyltransferase
MGDTSRAFKRAGSREFTVCIPILNQHEEAVKYLDSWFALAKGRISVVFIDNGSDEPFENRPELLAWRREGHCIRVIRNEDNTGVYPTFQQGYEECCEHNPWIFYSHSDVEMLVSGWDIRLNRLLKAAAARKAGACGMFGAIGIGLPGVYRTPYDLNQLQRWGCHTVESMAGAGGNAVLHDLTQCLVLDGFSLILHRDMIEEVGFDYESYPSHHMYDNDICLMSAFAGYNNFVLDIDCIHHGGMTSTREKWAEKMGSTDIDTHRAAHLVFYEKYRGKLPYMVGKSAYVQAKELVEQ